MPNPTGWIIFAAAGLIMFGVITYFAASYGLLGIFSKALCVMILLTVVVGIAAKS